MKKVQFIKCDPYAHFFRIIENIMVLQNSLHWEIKLNESKFSYIHYFKIMYEFQYTKIYNMIQILPKSNMHILLCWSIGKIWPPIFVGLSKTNAFCKHVFMYLMLHILTKQSFDYSYAYYVLLEYDKLSFLLRRHIVSSVSIFHHWDNLLETRMNIQYKLRVSFTSCVNTIEMRAQEHSAIVF